MKTSPAEAAARRPRRPLVAFTTLLLVIAVGCAPEPSQPPVTPAALLPGISIDGSWTFVEGDWTFTGHVDPEGDPTDVVLEVGPGPETARTFDTTVAVATHLVEPGPLTVTTREIPDVDEICVRFKATNSGGTSVSRPLCFPHDLPSIGPAVAPTAIISTDYTVDAGTGTFEARVDPGGAAATVVLEIGVGPEAAPTFHTQVPVMTDLTEVAVVQASTDQFPDAPEVCVRFTVTNEIGTASSAPLCFTPGD